MNKETALNAIEAALERIAKRPDLPNPDRDADWKNCMIWSSHEARAALSLIPALRNQLQGGWLPYDDGLKLRTAHFLSRFIPEGDNFSRIENRHIKDFADYIRDLPSPPTKDNEKE